MRNKIYIAMASVVFFLLQLTFCNYIKVYGIKPNLILVFIIALGFYADKSEVIFCGIFSGLLQDVLLAKSIGKFLVVNLLFCMIIKDDVVEDFGIIKAFVLSLLYDGLVLLFFAFPNTLKELLFVFGKILVGGALYNTICFTIVFLVVKRRRKIRTL